MSSNIHPVASWNFPLNVLHFSPLHKIRNSFKWLFKDFLKASSVNMEKCQGAIFCRIKLSAPKEF